jgi:hypothetical protein
MPLGVDIDPPREVQPSRRSATGKIRVAAGSKTRALIPCMLEKILTELMIILRSNRDNIIYSNYVGITH